MTESMSSTIATNFTPSVDHDVKMPKFLLTLL